MKGWECPRCGRCYAPDVVACGACSEAAANTGRLRDRIRPGASITRQAAAAVLALALPALAQEPPSTVSIEIGAGASLSDDSAILPVATVTVDAPVFLGDASVARVRAALRLHGSPGQTLDLRQVETFSGAELDLQLARRIGSGNASATYGVIGGGFATRRDARGEGPRQRYPIWYYGGLAVEHRSGEAPPSRRLVVGIGSSQVCHPESLAPRDLVVQGYIRLAELGPASFALQGDAARPLWGSGRGVFRIAVLAGWDG